MGGLRWRMSYSVTTINSVPRSRRRGIGFLECSDNGRVNAKRYFDKLREKTARDVRSRFDYWLRGGVFDKYFHGCQTTGTISTASYSNGSKRAPIIGSTASYITL